MYNFEIPKIFNRQMKVIILTKESPASAESVSNGYQSAWQKRPVNCSDQ